MTIIREKIFKDPIYGYISIPQSYCSSFIDSPIFQRLRRIEQTSMRILFPSAHHDRFSHSLGVFHLGKLAFQHLKTNSEDYFSQIGENQWKRYQKTFEIACLLHDCGHAPFSHTFESYYLHQNRGAVVKNRISEFFIGQQGFSDEFDAASPAPHEQLSALILLDYFGQKVLYNGADPLLAVRMILGCKYQTVNNDINRFESRLISLLNGSGIDVDSLDYIQRDTWASGFSNVEIDYPRLLSAIMIIPDKNNIPVIAFKKSVLSVIENISLGRNFLYKWIYSHHKVHYEQYLLKKIVDKLNSEKDDIFCRTAFSYESFYNVQKCDDMAFYLTSDDDIMHTIKNYTGKLPEVDEYLSRQFKYKALWKTYFEFNEYYFNDINSEDRMLIYLNINNPEFFNKFKNITFLPILIEPKLKWIEKDDFFIKVDDGFIDASKASKVVREDLKYFILYVSGDLCSFSKNDIIDEVRKLRS